VSVTDWGAQGEEVVLPFAAPRDRIERSTAFRSTWITSSLQSLRVMGLFERYLELLRSHRDELGTCVAGVWLPMAVARAHYEACDGLRLATDEQVAVGRAVGERARGTWLSPTIRVARAAGVTPWTMLPHLNRLWTRAAMGGGVAVFRLGPKEARIEFVGCELFDIPYFRHGLRGVLLSIGDLFARKGYIQDLPFRQPGEANFRAQWV